jgi:hypothetical protein
MINPALLLYGLLCATVAPQTPTSSTLATPLPPQAALLLAGPVAAAEATADDAAPKAVARKKTGAAFSLPATLVGVGIGAVAAGVALFSIQAVQAADLKRDHMRWVKANVYETDLTEAEYQRISTTINAELYSSIALGVVGLALTALGVTVEVLAL